jgi:hypothetical protein
VKGFDLGGAGTIAIKINSKSKISCSGLSKTTVKSIAKISLNENHNAKNRPQKPQKFLL